MVSGGSTGWSLQAGRGTGLISSQKASLQPGGLTLWPQPLRAPPRVPPPNTSVPGVQTQQSVGASGKHRDTAPLQRAVLTPSRGRVPARLWTHKEGHLREEAGSSGRRAHTQRRPAPSLPQAGGPGAPGMRGVGLAPVGARATLPASRPRTLQPQALLEMSVPHPGYCLQALGKLSGCRRNFILWFI